MYFRNKSGNPPQKIKVLKNRIFQYATIRRNHNKKVKITESQIIGILKEGENGIPVAELFRRHGMSDATFYNWRSKYGGMNVSMMNLGQLPVILK